MRTRRLSILWLAAVMTGATGAEPPPEARDLLAEGIRLHDAGRYDDALAMYRRVLEIDPRNVDALYEAAFATYGKGDFDGAIRRLESLVAAPASAPARAWVLLGSSHAMRGDWTRAEAVFRRGTGYRPDDLPLRFHLALSLAALGRSDTAVVEFEGCVRLAPYRAETWRALGDALYASGSKGKAFAAYARAFTLEADEARSEAVAKRLWSMLFEGAEPSDEARPRGSSSADAAEVAGLSMIGLLRQHASWREKSDASFFAYALDTMLKLMSALHASDREDPFWGPFVLAYFDTMRAGGHLEAMAYDIREAAGDPEASRWNARNGERLVAFRRSSERWAVDRRTESESGVP